MVSCTQVYVPYPFSSLSLTLTLSLPHHTSPHLTHRHRRFQQCNLGGGSCFCLGRYLFSYRLLEAVHDNVVLLDEFGFDEKLLHVPPLVTLDLDHLTEFVVLHDGSVAVELLPEFFEHLLEVVAWIEALYGGQRLASIPLLHSYVHFVGGHRRAPSRGVFLLLRVLERVKGTRQASDVQLKRVGHKTTELLPKIESLD